MTIVGQAQVLVAPTFKGFQRGVSKEMAGAGAQAGQTGGRSLSESLGKWGKRGAAVAGGAIAGVLGASLVSGFGRLRAIEEAQAKLRGLGHDADSVRAIMDNALASVKGTSFGLGEAATTAAGAVAAGIKPGDDLERVLKSVSNSAAAAGTGMDEMGSIYNKVASLGKAQNDSLQQVADRGIPIYQALAEQMGVTTEEVFKMASAGEISFADFETAMTSASGTVAAEMGTTFTGSLKNMWAAVGRVGANFLSGIYPQFAGAFTGITTALGPIEDRAAAVGEALGKWSVRGIEAARQAIAAFTSAWSYNDGEVTSSGFNGYVERFGFIARQVFDYVRGTVIPTLQTMGTWLLDNRDKVALVLAAVTGAAAGFLAMQGAIAAATAVLLPLRAAIFAVNLVLNANPISLVVLAIGALVGALVWLYRNNDDARRIMQSAWAGIQQAVSWAWERVIKPAVTALVGFVRNTLAPAAMWLWRNVIVPAFNGISSAVQWAWNNVIKPAVTALVWYLRNVVGPAATWLWKNVMQPAWAGIQFAISVFWNAAKLVLDIAVFYFRNVLAPVFTWLWKNVAKPVFEGIGSAIKWQWDNVIKPVLQALGGFIRDTVAPAFSKGVDAIRAAWDRVMEIARRPVNFVIDTVYNNGIRKAFEEVAKAVGSDARLPRMPLVGAAPSGGGGGGRGAASGVVARARGGWTRPGTVLVGEEGPELVDFRTPGRVYTAKQSQQMMHGIGGPLERAASTVRSAARSAIDMVTDPLAWVRRQVSNVMGQIPGGGTFGAIVKAIPGKMLDVLKDKLQGMLGGFGADDAGTTFTGGTGPYRRPGRGRVTSEFGMRRNPVTGVYKLHNGIDLAAGMGSPIVAARAGAVRSAGRQGSYGNRVELDHGGGVRTGYAHLSSILARVGQVVAAGQLIGREGSTGNSTGPHLHYNVWRGGRWVNPRSVQSFDEGGLLTKGVHQIVHGASKPDRVFNDHQWSTLDALAARGAQATSPALPDRVTLVLASGDEFSAYVRREAGEGTRHNQRMYQ